MGSTPAGNNTGRESERANVRGNFEGEQKESDTIAMLKHFHSYFFVSFSLFLLYALLILIFTSLLLMGFDDVYWSQPTNLS